MPQLSWAVSEIHIIDPRNVPNGRRDNFLDHVQYTKVIKHLGPLNREIARICRTSLIRQRWLREFELEEADFRAKLRIIELAKLGLAARDRATRAIRESLAQMEKVGRMGVFESGDAQELQKTVASAPSAG